VESDGIGSRNPSDNFDHDVDYNDIDHDDDDPSQLILRRAFINLPPDVFGG
jgi:hypothetical protein